MARKALKEKVRRQKEEVKKSKRLEGASFREPVKKKKTLTRQPTRFFNDVSSQNQDDFVKSRVYTPIDMLNGSNTRSIHNGLDKRVVKARGEISDDFRKPVEIKPMSFTGLVSPRQHSLLKSPLTIQEGFSPAL